MNCKRLQQQVCVQSGTETPLTEAVQTHLQTCVACAAFAAQLERIDTGLLLWESRPSPELEARIFTHIAAQTLPATQPKSRLSAIFAERLWKIKEQRTMKRTLSWGLAAIATGLVLTSGLQVSRGNTPLRRMGKAAKSVQSVHLIGWSCESSSDVEASVENGSVHTIADAMPHRIEGWIKDGHWRETKSFDVTLYHKGKTWRNTKPVPAETTPPLISAFAFQAVAGDDPFGKGVTYTTQLEADVLADGQAVDKLTLETEGNTQSPERRVFWVDKATYLPLRMEALRFAYERWALVSVLSYDYNLPIDDTLFDPTQAKFEREISSQGFPSARELYRMTDKQAAQWKRVLEDKSERSEQIKQNLALSPEEKTTAEVENGTEFRQQAAAMMTRDQRRLWNDWFRVSDEMGRKLWTPDVKKADAKWRQDQRKLYKVWLNGQDERTQQLLQGRDPL